MNFYQDIIDELKAYFSCVCSKKQIKMLKEYLLQEDEGRKAFIENFQKERNIKAQYIETALYNFYAASVVIETSLHKA